MAKIELSKMSDSELQALRKDIDREMEKSAERNRKEALAAIEAKAKEMGFTLQDLTGSGSKKAKKAKKAPAPAKYRHPENSELTWSGRGRQPRWIKEGLESGKAMEEYAI